MGRKLSDIIKDRNFFTEEQEKRIHENAMKEAQACMKNESVDEEQKED